LLFGTIVVVVVVYFTKIINLYRGFQNSRINQATFFCICEVKVEFSKILENYTDVLMSMEQSATVCADAVDTSSYLSVLVSTATTAFV